MYKRRYAGLALLTAAIAVINWPLIWSALVMSHGHPGIFFELLSWWLQ